MSAETECDAYNAAFHALGLHWHWDPETYVALQSLATPCERIRRYLEMRHPHLLKAYDAEFLSQAIETRKPPRGAHVDWAQASVEDVGV